MKISSIGLIEAAKKLIPITIISGRVACHIQDGLIAGRVQNTLSKEEEEGYNKQALTDADLVSSNLIGAVALTTFSDVSYLSEEAKADNVSKYFLMNAPFTIVFDPLNGTSYLRDGKKCFENIYTLTDALHGNVQNSERVVVVNIPRAHKIYVGNECGVEVADTTSFIFDGSCKLEYTKHHIPTKAKGGVYVSVSLKDSLNDIRSLGLDVESHVAHHIYKEYGIKDPNWNFVPAGILNGDISAFAIKGIDLMDSLAIAYLAQGSGAYTLIKGYHPETHIADLAICANDKKIFDAFCTLLT